MFQVSPSHPEAPSEQPVRPSFPLTRRNLLRTMAVGSVALVGGAALAACGGDSKSATVNVTFYTNGWPGDSAPSEADQKKSPTLKAYAATLDKWIKKNPGVTIKHSATNIWDTPGLTAAISAGTSPTWFMGDVLGSFNKLSTRNAFTRGLAAEVTSLVEQYDIEGQLSDFVVPPWRGWKVNDKYYCTPGGYGAGNGIFYRRDLFKENGIDDPSLDWTWEDFRNIAKKLTKGKMKGSALQWYAFSQNIAANQLTTSPDAYGTIGVLPAPKENWHWKFDLMPYKAEYTKAIENWRGMMYTDKSLVSNITAGDSDVAQAFIRQDVAMMGNNTDYFTRSPDDPSSVVQLVNKLNKPFEEVIGWTAHPIGFNGAFGGTQSGLAVGCVIPQLQRKEAELAKAFDFLVYMLMGEGMLDQAIGAYNATKDLKRVFSSVPPMTKNRVHIEGIPGTAEDAWGKHIVDSVTAAANLPQIPSTSEYLKVESNAGIPDSAFKDAISGLAFTQDGIEGILQKLNDTLNQQAASLSSSISADEFVTTVSAYYSALNDFWKKNAPGFYASDFQPWYEEKVLPTLK